MHASPLPTLELIKFLYEFNLRIVQPVRNNPDMLYNNYWKNPIKPYNYSIMETIKFYDIIVRGNARGGVLYPPQSWPRPIAIDGEDVKNWQSLVVELKYGPYRNFNMCVGNANIVSENFKAVIDEVAGNNPDLEFLPIRATSIEYGDRDYYIMHFKKVFDVLDKKNTVYAPNTNSVIKPWVDFEKVGTLKVFNSQPYINDVIVSDDIRRLLKRKHLDDGIEFMPVYCEIKE